MRAAVGSLIARRFYFIVQNYRKLRVFLEKIRYFFYKISFWKNPSEQICRKEFAYEFPGVLSD